MPDYVLTPVVTPLLLAQAVTLLMIGNVLQRAAQPVHRALLALLLGNSVWLLGEILVHLAVSPTLRWSWGLTEFFGILTMPVAWVALVERYLRPHPEPLPRGRLLALLALPAVTLLLIWTNGAHQWVWSYTADVPQWGQVRRNAVYWLGVVLYPNALLVWGALRLLPVWRSSRGTERAQITVMLLAVVVPAVTNMFHLLGVPLLAAVNPTPVSFALSLVPVAWGMARYGLLRVAPLAHRQVVEQLADAVFVLDARGRIVEANARASRLAGQPAADLRGHRPGDLFPSWPPLDGQVPAEWPSGEEVWEVQLSTVHNAQGGRVGQAVVARNVTTRAREHARIRQLANEDALTGLGNRRAFEADLTRELARANRHALCLGVVMVDLDGLKAVNDRRGHAYGDELLLAFGQALAAAFRSEDRAYRLGGDEFAVLLAQSTQVGEPAVRERVARSVAAVRARGFPEVGASFGAAYFPGDGAGEALVRLADARMYEDKAQRRGRRGQHSRAES
ncbi:PAS/PAC sensor-containing diguanylate cyclase [Deinococcus phoenicis]|uniref:PAS/PAC sensor-containing diguanylate cyclase n=1 Tax=Deinococcus phoenicis TaxID=1476583 RepID=A0A016QRC5_9DEIO|nr:histidine kinase N-terminal 7TM domain-containing protein [Deinococcus phoenicis]EYB68690.1 PAS/PAC sensor-containing diguanylate cyclase [Deinococcus phoenicis]